jgi:hypothetical protein
LVLGGWKRDPQTSSSPSASAKSPATVKRTRQDLRRTTRAKR